MPTLNGFRSFKGFRYYDSSSVALKTRINFKRYILLYKKSCSAFRRLP